VTEGTFDAYLYQLVENKQKFISQIMTSKTPVRVAEDIDETALSFATVKALATGNPLIIEKAQLDADVQKLKILEASHRNQQYTLEDAIAKEYPREIKRLTEEIEGYKADAATLEKHPTSPDHFPPMTVGGIVYTEKEAAGKAIIAACKAMESTEPIDLGEYRGFHVSLSFNGLGALRLALLGKRTHLVELGDDVYGNITRIDNVLARLEPFLQSAERNLEEVHQQLEVAKEEVLRLFPQQQEFDEKSTRLQEVNILLGLDEPDDTVLDCEPDEYDMTAEHGARRVAAGAR